MEQVNTKCPDAEVQIGEIVILARHTEKGFETQYFADGGYDFLDLAFAAAVIEATLACEAAQRKGNQENPLSVSQIIDVIAEGAKNAAEVIQDIQQADTQSADSRKE